MSKGRLLVSVRGPAVAAEAARDGAHIAVADFRTLRREMWIAGSITLEEIPARWATSVDVICVRAAACSDHVSDHRSSNVELKAVASLLPPD